MSDLKRDDFARLLRNVYEPALVEMLNTETPLLDLFCGEEYPLEGGDAHVPERITFARAMAAELEGLRDDFTDELNRVRMPARAKRFDRDADLVRKIDRALDHPAFATSNATTRLL